MNRIISRSAARLVSVRLLPQRFTSSSSTSPLTSTSTPNNNNTTTTLKSHFSTSTTNKMSSSAVNATSVIEQFKNRRTYYPLSKDLPISKERIQEIVKEAIQHVPSSFNSQSNRAVVLFGAEHEKLWDFTTEVLKAIVPEDKFESTAGRMAMFKGGAGTVLFFEDQDVVKGMQAAIPAYADQFPVWATQSNAMLQFATWVALEAEGLGANLQHYNPLIDAKVADEWKIPASWKLTSQLVFGGRTGPAGDKEFKPVEDKFKVFGA